LTPVVQAAVLDGLMFDAPPFGQDGFATTKVDVGRGEVADAQDFATRWLWTYNNDRPNIPFMVCRQTIAGQWGIGGITPAQKMKMAA
jgi:hypothetical protein